MSSQRGWGAWLDRLADFLIPQRLLTLMNMVNAVNLNEYG